MVLILKMSNIGQCPIFVQYGIKMFNIGKHFKSQKPQNIKFHKFQNLKISKSLKNIKKY